jgi:cyclase
VEQAKAYDAAGADELCFLDIKATHENRGTLYDLARRTAEHCFYAADRWWRCAHAS